MINNEKMQEFGVHAHRYYKLEVEIFKSNVDTMVLERLWNEYWMQTLSSSPLLEKQTQMNMDVINVVNKLNGIKSLLTGTAFNKKQTQHKTEAEKIIDKEQWEPIEEEAA